MEWVETTGPTVDAALDAALDELGVDTDDVEYEVLEEARSGLFGRLGGHPARIRARVKPISREKPGERGRGRGGRPRRDGGRGGNGNGGRRPRRGGGGAASGAATGASTGASRNASEPGDGDGDGAGQAGDKTQGGEGGRSRSRGRRRGGRRGSGGGQRPQQEETTVSTTPIEEVPIGEQADVADEFMRGLVDAFGLQGEVSVRIEDDVVLVDVDGDDLGLLVGPKGATLRAIEDLVRTVVQRRTDGHGARIHVDVGGYQAKRRAALERFAVDLANRVLEAGEELALEPMPPADRKVVHDAVAEVDGVTTISEGEEPRRRVVLRPE